MAAEAPPTFRFADRQGATVLEATGTWTVLSLRAIGRQLKKASKPAMPRHATIVDTTGKTLDAVVLEILALIRAARSPA